MNLSDFKRLIRPLANKVFLLLGRAVLKAIDNSESTQKIQVLALADETISDIERFQSYGIDSYPLAEAEVFLGFLNGNRDHGIAIIVHDRRYRPQYLASGEVILYNYENNPDSATSGDQHHIRMKAGRTIEIKSNKIDTELDDDKTEQIGGNWSVTISGSSTIDGQGTITIRSNGSPINIDTGGGEVDIKGSPSAIKLGSGAGTLEALMNETFGNKYDTHTHPESGGGTTGAPNQSVGATDKTSIVSGV